MNDPEISVETAQILYLQFYGKEVSKAFIHHEFIKHRLEEVNKAHAKLAQSLDDALLNSEYESSVIGDKFQLYKFDDNSQLHITKDEKHRIIEVKSQ